MSKPTFSARLATLCSSRASILAVALGLGVAACGKSDSKDSSEEVKAEADEAKSDSAVEPSEEVNPDTDTDKAAAEKAAEGAPEERRRRGPRGRANPDEIANGGEGANPGVRPNPGERRNPGERPPPVRLPPPAGDAATADAANPAEPAAKEGAAPAADAKVPSAAPILPEKGTFAQAEIPADAATDSPEAPSSAAARANLPAIDPMRVLPLNLVIDTLKGKRLSYTGPLAGIALGSGYTSAVYASPDKGKLGVTLQVWQDPTRRETDERYRRMRMQYPNAEDVTQLNPVKAYFATFNGIQTLTFGDSLKRAVGSVSCDEATCDHEQLLKLARSLRDRL